jgi:hypothetical protein
MNLDTSTVSLLIAFLALVISGFAWSAASKKPENVITKQGNQQLLPLQLQAYERLVLLCERISLPNLISRTAASDLSAKQMQYVLLENIKQEFEYNASQQIYVSPLAWESVRNLKDQSMLIINQISNAIPAESRATDLNKQLLEVIIQQQDKALHSMVLETLNFEAKKLLEG